VVNSHLANNDWSYIFYTCVCIEDLLKILIRFVGLFMIVLMKNVPHSTSKGSRWNNKRLDPCTVCQEARNQETSSLEALKGIPFQYKLICSNFRQAKLDATRKFEESIIHSGNLSKFFRYANMLTRYW